MAPRKKADPEKIKDEPGAEERFKGILRRVLSTPPARKQDAKRKRQTKPTETKP